MKYLGIDYGRRRLGLAWCGPLKVACPGEIIRRSTPAQDMAALAAVVEKHEIGKIIVGLPKNMDDSHGEMAEEATKFADVLREHLQISVDLWDERLTSWQAEKILLNAGLTRARRKKYQDAIAACIILQSYVDSNPTSLGEEENGADS